MSKVVIECTETAFQGLMTTHSFRLVSEKPLERVGGFGMKKRRVLLLYTHAHGALKEMNRFKLS